MSGGLIAQDYRPATFLERGVAVPFTTPVLATARARPAQRIKIEFVVANPSGGAGWYVMPWDALRLLSKISVHDLLLYESVSREELITPHTIRQAAREVAVSGAAGRPALKAAQAARQKETDDQLIGNYLLITRLMKQAGVRDIDWRAVDPSNRDIKQTMRGHIAKLQPTLNATPETIYQWLEELSRIVAPVGFGGREYPARLSANFDSLRVFHQTITAFANSDGGDAGYSARFIAQVAQHTLDVAEVIFQDCHKELEDLIRLLANWSRTRERVLERFGRPDWLLDGWQGICAIWEDATGGGRDAQRAAVIELQRHIPVMPKEVSEWVDGVGNVDRAWQQRRWVKANTDWRSGLATLDGVARNEALRARVP